MKHPEQDAIRFARGKTVANLPSLQDHLADCPECSALVLFVQKLNNFLRSKQSTGSERPDIDRELQRIGLDRTQVREIVQGFANEESRKSASENWKGAVQGDILIVAEQERLEALEVLVDSTGIGLAVVKEPIPKDQPFPIEALASIKAKINEIREFVEPVVLVDTPSGNHPTVVDLITLLCNELPATGIAAIVDREDPPLAIEVANPNALELIARPPDATSLRNAFGRLVRWSRAFQERLRQMDMRSPMDLRERKQHAWKARRRTLNTEKR